ncbi:MAG: hypothetical protein AAB317_00515 [Nitrospirota bacterium]
MKPLLVVKSKITRQPFLSLSLIKMWIGSFKKNRFGMVSSFEPMRFLDIIPVFSRRSLIHKGSIWNFMISQRKITLLQKSISVVSLFAFLCGSVLGLPFLAVLLHPHQVIMIQDQNHLDLVLHHPGHHDAHADSTLALGNASHAASDTADHAFHLSPLKPQIISTQVSKIAHPLFYSTAAPIRFTMIPADSTPNRSSLDFPPSLTLAILKTTVLRI